MRQRLKIIETYKVIKNVSDTNFLDEITEKMIKKRQQELNDQFNRQKKNENSQNDEEEFRFDNMTASSKYNPLHKTMIYDSECSDHLTYDKDRFIDEIRPACE
jgi:uncharacterized iron-regulated protein